MKSYINVALSFAVIIVLMIVLVASDRPQGDLGCDVRSCFAAGNYLPEYIDKRSQRVEYKKLIDKCQDKDMFLSECQGFTSTPTGNPTIDADKCHSAVFGSTASSRNENGQPIKNSYMNTANVYGLVALERLNLHLFCTDVDPFTKDRLSDAQDYKIYIKDIKNVIFDIDSMPIPDNIHQHQNCYSNQYVTPEDNLDTIHLKWYDIGCYNFLETKRQVILKDRSLPQDSVIMPNSLPYLYTCMELNKMMKDIRADQKLFVKRSNMFYEITDKLPLLKTFHQGLIDSFKTKCLTDVSPRYNDFPQWIGVLPTNLRNAILDSTKTKMGMDAEKRANVLKAKADAQVQEDTTTGKM